MTQIGGIEAGGTLNFLGQICQPDKSPEIKSVIVGAKQAGVALAIHYTSAPPALHEWRAICVVLSEVS